MKLTLRGFRLQYLRYNLTTKTFYKDGDGAGGAGKGAGVVGKEDHDISEEGAEEKNELSLPESD
jgi:hypothetical protein